MAVIAQWLNKTWKINPKKILALDKLTTSYKLKAETNGDAEGKPSSNVRGMELQPLSFEMFVSDAVGLDVLNEIESWSGLVGQSAPFILAGKRFGPDKLRLTTVGVSDTVIDDFGRIRQARLSLTFEEDAGEAANSKPKTGSGSSVSPGIVDPSTYAALGIGGSASDIRATPKVGITT